MPATSAGMTSQLRRPLISLEGNRVHQPALGPGRVEAAIELERACLADIAFEDLGIVATRLDRLHHPFVIEPEPRAEVARRAKQALDRRDGGLGHFVGIAGGDAEFFRLDETIV